MADDIAPAQPAASPEAAPAANASELGSEAQIESMLASVPGFDKYFGTAEESDKTKKEGNVATEPATAAAPTATSSEPAAVVDEILAGGATEESKEAPTVPKEDLPPSVRERIDRLTAQKHEFEERVTLAEKKVQDLEAKLAARPAVQSSPKDPLAHVDDMQALERLFLETKQIKDWAIKNLDGGQVKIGEEIRDLSGEQVKNLFAMSEQSLSEDIPKRKAYLDARSDFERQAKSYYPDLAKPGTELQKTVASWIETFPEMLRFPDYQIIVADALVGQKLRMQRLAAAKNGNGSAPSKTPTLAAPSPSSAPRVPAKSVLSSDLLERMANDRSALDIFSESLIGSGSKK